MNRRDKKLLAAYERGFALQQEYLGTDKPVNRIEPLVSVRTITYQHAPFIRQCLDSILMQETDFPWEFIIGEDGSTDGTREICIEYAERHPDRIRLFLRDRSLSRFKEGDREKGFNGLWTRRSARGKYIAVCEGDDYWTDPKKLQKQVEYLEANTDVSMCYHNNLLVWEDGRSEPRLMLPPNVKPFVTISEISFDVMPHTATVLYRNNLLPTIPPAWLFRTPIGDWSLYVMLAQHGKLGYIPDTMSVYRHHAGGVWTSRSLDSAREGIVETLCLLKRELRLDVDQLNQYIIRHRVELQRTYSRRNEFGPAARHAGPLLLASFSRSEKTLAGISRRRLLSIWLRGYAPRVWRVLSGFKSRVWNRFTHFAGARRD
jgi:glycosyltransferase involved in cell wall biosynthesis